MNNKDRVLVAALFTECATNIAVILIREEGNHDSYNNKMT